MFADQRVEKLGTLGDKMGTPVATLSDHVEHKDSVSVWLVQFAQAVRHFCMKVIALPLVKHAVEAALVLSINGIRIFQKLN